MGQSGAAAETANSPVWHEAQATTRDTVEIEKQRAAARRVLLHRNRTGNWTVKLRAEGVRTRVQLPLQAPG